MALPTTHNDYLVLLMENGKCITARNSNTEKNQIFILNLTPKYYSVVKKCANFSRGVLFPEGSVLEFNGVNSLDEKSIGFSRVVKNRRTKS
jgi:hypothetical protein